MSKREDVVTQADAIAALYERAEKAEAALRSVEAENERLRAALKGIRETTRPDKQYVDGAVGRSFRLARAALEGGSDE